MQRTRLTVIGFLLAVLGSGGCTGARNESLPISNPYLPLKVGNTWVYLDQTRPGDTIYQVVIGEMTVDGRPIFKTEREWRRNGSRISIEENYWSYGDSGKILQASDYNNIRSSGAKYYCTTADSGENWDARASPTSYVQFLGRREVLLSSGKAFSGCLSFYVSGNDGEFGVDLAEGIGVVKWYRWELAWYHLRQ
jgi:hypothetical protein